MRQIFYTLAVLEIIFLTSCSKQEKVDTGSTDSLPIVNSNTPVSSGNSQTMGALESVIQDGDFNGWNIRHQDGNVYLKNSADPNSIRYYFAPITGENGSLRTASVKVNLNRAEQTGKAGLLYGFDAKTKNYWMITLDSKGSLEIFRRDSSGIRNLSSQTTNPSSTGDYNLSIEESNHMVNITVNGQSTGGFQPDVIGSGAIGIAAISTGEFKFSAFTQAVKSADKELKSQQSFTTVSQNNAVKTTQKQAPPKPDPSLGEAVEFTEKTVYDEGRNNFPAYTVLVPKGWEFKASVTAPNTSLYNIPYIADIIVKSPDKKRYVHFYPFAEFGYNDQVQGQAMKQAFDGRFFMRRPNSLGEYWLYLISLDPKQSVSNARVVSEEIAKEATEYMRKASRYQYEQAEVFNRQNSFNGTRFVFDIQVRQLVVRYTYESIDYEEVMYATWGQSTVWYPNGTIKAAMWNLSNMYAVGGPPGSDYLQDPVLATVLRSKRANKDWTYAIDLFYQNRRDIIIKQGMAAAAAAQNNWKNTRSTQSSDILDISFNGWKKRNNMNSAGHSSTINSIHERTTYNTPGGSQVNLPSYYNQVYTDGNGKYLLHNNANYQINSDPRYNQQNWQKINPVQNR